MKKKTFILAWVSLFYCVFTACENKEEEKALQCAYDFSQYYFNLNFDRAYTYCTAESKKWMAFKASNITRRDMETFAHAESPALVSVSGFRKLNDSTAQVSCTVEQALDADSLEQQTSRIIPRRTYICILVRREGKWKVKMEGPLQNEE